MNDLIIKNVDFFGDTLIAAKDNDGIVWAGVNYFCRGIGLSKSQRDTQVQNIQTDEILKRGCLKFQAGVFDNNNEVLALQLDFVPLWLAKISITPTMKEHSPELVDKLVNYQLKAKDVLAAAFLPTSQHIKHLTITSRDICRIMGKPLNQHGIALRDIRDCIAELEGMGFNRLDFFQDSTYIGGNKEVQPQFLVTERGCEFYSGRLESEERRQFIKEYTDRFERLKLAAEGGPIKALETLAEGQGTVIRIYQNNKWGILSMNGELYNLTPDELKLISELVPKLDKNGVRQIPQIISTMLEGADRSGKLEKIGQYCLHDSGEVSYSGGDTPALPGAVNQIQDKKQIVNLNEAINLTKEQARARYGIGFVNLRDLADKIGAINYCGNRILFVRQILDDYFNKGDQTYRPGR